jgi:hypothetical protein
MNHIELGDTFPRTLCLIIGGLFIFGIYYNNFVARLERHGHDRGYLSFIVALGNLITFTGASLAIAAATSAHVGLLAWAITLLSFCASGIPMIWGSVTRYMHQRETTDQAVANLPAAMLDQIKKIRGGNDHDEQTHNRRDHIQTGDQTS